MKSIRQTPTSPKITDPGNWFKLVDHVKRLAVDNTICVGCGRGVVRFNGKVFRIDHETTIEQVNKFISDNVEPVQA